MCPGLEAKLLCLPLSFSTTPHSFSSSGHRISKAFVWKVAHLQEETGIASLKHFLALKLPAFFLCTFHTFEKDLALLVETVASPSSHGQGLCS